MDFSFNEEQKALVALVKEFCLKEIDKKWFEKNADKPYSEHPDKEEMMARIPWDILDKAMAVGLRQLTIPKKYGGGGLGYVGDWVTMTAVAEAMGYYGCVDFYRMQGYAYMVSATIMAYAPEEVSEIWYTDYMKGRTLGGGAALTEPDHGSDILMPYDEPGYTGKVTAKLDGNEWVINGDKAYSSFCLVSNYMIVAARTEPNGPYSKAMTLFLVPTYLPGWTYAPNPMCGEEAGLNCRMTFDNVRIPKNYMISKLNDGFGVLKAGTAGKNIHFMANLGATRKQWEEIRDYARQRIQGGKPLTEHSTVKALLAKADIMIETSRLLQYKYAWDCDQEKPGMLVNPVLGFYNNYWYKEVFKVMMEVGSEIYGGQAPNTDLTFEHYVRHNFGILHGGSCGIMNLIKGFTTDMKFKFGA
jgi:alkylation response protein AidB-like acyl-CoA dehydrogenase